MCIRGETEIIGISIEFVDIFFPELQFFLFNKGLDGMPRSLCYDAGGPLRGRDVQVSMAPGPLGWLGEFSPFKSLLK